MGEPEIIGTEVISDNGIYRRIRRYYRGMHPELGVLHRGWSGWETVREMDVIVPKYFFSIEKS